MFRSSWGSIGLPDDGYGFDFHEELKTTNDDDDKYALKQACLPDVPITLKNGHDFTHRFIVGDYEYKMVKMIGGETYQGCENLTVDTPVVGKIGGILFDVAGSHCESFYDAADSTTGDAYEAMINLFTCDGKPKNTLKKKAEQKEGYCRILFIPDVFLTKKSMGQGLGMEMVRALISSLQENEEYDPDMIVIDDSWYDSAEMTSISIDSEAYKMLSKDYLYEKLGFKEISTRGKQSHYKFWETLGTMWFPGRLGNKTWVSKPKKRQLSEEISDGGKENAKKQNTMEQEQQVNIDVVKNA